MPKILVVDDSAIPRLVLRKMLERSGHHVIEAADEEGALAAHQREQPDVVVLDLLLKDRSGLDVLARLRGVDPEVRVIIVTGETDAATEQRVLSSGAQAFVSKSSDAGRLLATVESVLTRSTCALQIDRLHACIEDVEAERTCLDRLLVSVPERLEQMQTAVAAGDAQRVHLDAHTLKGSCRMLGADALASVCEVLEANAKRGDLGRAHALLAQAQHELTRLRQAIEAYLTDSRDGSTRSPA